MKPLITLVEHAGDCSCYKPDSDICDCGALRKAASGPDSERVDEVWMKHLAAIDLAAAHSGMNCV